MWFFRKRAKRGQKNVKTAESAKYLRIWAFNVLKKGKWLRAIIARNKLQEKVLFVSVHTKIKNRVEKNSTLKWVNQLSIFWLTELRTIFLLVTRYSLPFNCYSYSLLVTFYWLLVTFYSLLVTFYSLFVPFYSLLLTFYLLHFTRYSLLFSRYFLLVTRYFLLVTCYVYSLLSATYL